MWKAWFCTEQKLEDKVLICLLTLLISDFIGIWRSALEAKIETKNAKRQGFGHDLEKTIHKKSLLFLLLAKLLKNLHEGSFNKYKKMFGVDFWSFVFRIYLELKEGPKILLNIWIFNFCVLLYKKLSELPNTITFECSKIL